MIEADDASDAIRQIEKDLSINHLFTDIVMPNDMNGVELMAKARELRPELPALLTSGYTRDALRETTGLPDDVAFLPKPYKMADLFMTFGGRAPKTGGWT